MKRLPLLFIGMSIFFGTFIFLLTQNWMQGIIMGVLFGGTMILVLGIMHYVSNKNQGTDVNGPLKAEESILLKMPEKEAVEVCLEAIDRLEHISSVKMKQEEQQINARTKATWKTWGENIQCRITASDEVTVKVYIQSRPKLSTTLIDYGINQRNIQQILAALPEERWERL